MIANTVEGELIIMQMHSNIVWVCVFVCVSGGGGGGGCGWIDEEDEEPQIISSKACCLNPAISTWDAEVEAGW